MGLNGRRLALARPDGSTLVSHGTQIRTVVPASPYVAVGGKILHSKSGGVSGKTVIREASQLTARSRIDLSDATIENSLCRVSILQLSQKNEADRLRSVALGVNETFSFFPLFF